LSRAPTAWLFGLLLATAPLTAKAEEPLIGALVPELVLGAGYDDNVFLDAFPVGPLDTPPARDAIFDVNPRLAARIGKRGHAFSLAIDDLERFTISSGHLRDLDVRLGYRTPQLGRVEIFATLGYQHWDATLYPDNRSERASGEVSARLLLKGPLEGSVGMQAAGRFYPERGQRDVDARPWLSLRVVLPPKLSIDLTYRFLHLASTEPRAELDRHSLDLGLSSRPVTWLGLRASYSLSVQHLPAGAADATGASLTRDDLRHELHALVTARPLSWLEVFCEYDLLVSTSDQSGGRFRRNQVVAGLAAYGVFTSRFRRASLTPKVQGQLVTFRYRGKANRVSVVGDWNGWDADAAPLLREGDLFTGTFSIPVGRHAYALSVDGVVEPPPEADTYISDEFGGKNGVVVVR